MGPRLIGLVAGEASGDLLGAALVRALRGAAPGIRTVGVAGEAMRAAGCEAIADVEELAVMGLTEVVGHLPRLLALRRRLVAELAARRPDIVVGIDAPDFNLGLERRLKERGIATAHYVSPSVWAWRPGRVRTVAESARLLLCLLPFEPAYYEGSGVKAVFVGHPLADELRPVPRHTARTALGLGDDGRVLAVLPGSRRGEVRRLAPRFLAACAELARSRPDLRCVIPVARPSLAPILEGLLARRPRLPVRLVAGHARDCIAAADAVLAASGTAALETLLLERPLVVAYRLHTLTAWILRRPGVLRTQRFSLPNILAGRPVVPELLQEAASPARLAETLRPLVDDEPGARQAQISEFVRIRTLLGGGAAERAAAALLDAAAAG